MNRYRHLQEPGISLNRNQTIAIYLNCVCSALSFLVLIIIASMLGPVANDAGVLINDASQSLDDFSIMIPEVNKLIPEAMNTTHILGHMIPRVNQGLYILRQICRQDPQCQLH